MSNYLDTRDLYKRQQELEDLKQTVESAAEELQEAEQALAEHDTVDNRTSHFDWAGGKEELETAVGDANDALDSAKEDFGDDEQTELEELDTLESEVGREWRHGETLIPEDDFENYARELACDLGSIPDDAGWPCTCIDWEQAADELRQDYSSADYQGTTYLFRA